MAVHTPLRGLRCFCVAAECLSFKETASQLYLTPSAVSHQIKQLEENLGFSLFERQTRAVVLTAEGRRFYQAIQPVLQSLSATVAEFCQTKREQVVSITLPEFFASEFFVPRLVGWSSQHPQVNLRLETVKSRQESSRHTDLQIVLASSKPTDKTSYQLFPISYVPACSPEWYQRLQGEPGELPSLETVPLIVHQARPWCWHQWADQAGYDDFRPRQIIQLDSMFSVARAAQQGLGVALIPLPISQAWFDSGSLVRLFEDELHTRDHYYLVQHEDSLHKPEIQLLIDWVLAGFAKTNV
ncbi:LysR substrate-binding domain-containing protein [Rheinheimera sp.]|uniref:LysR substrate-binding domain-containing protein n=1 Tax=Rheinheimera sp. TaxID=1869214 RepID=UPI0027B8A79A|nr:LysR substrate-binding domain-containing protein [Rheinheimera sp.]